MNKTKKALSDLLEGIQVRDLRLQWHLAQQHLELSEYLLSQQQNDIELCRTLLPETYQLYTARLTALRETYEKKKNGG